jgi:hypothetical protein
VRDVTTPCGASCACVCMCPMSYHAVPVWCEGGDHGPSVEVAVLLDGGLRVRHHTTVHHMHLHRKGQGDTEGEERGEVRGEARDCTAV